MYIYVASSWRNNHQPELINTLTRAGHKCYDFRHEGFSWKQVNPTWETDDCNFFNYVNMLQHPRAQQGFDRDFNAMKRADAFILVLPAGRSANLEAGWAIGQGKPTAVFMPEYDTPDLMYKMADLITDNTKTLLEWVHHIGMTLPLPRRSPILTIGSVNTFCKPSCR